MKKITSNQIGSMIYAINRSAKKFRDEERYYRNIFDRNTADVQNEIKAKIEKEYMYELKKRVLKLFKPTCIHKITRTTESKVFDWMDEFNAAFERDSEQQPNVHYMYDGANRYHQYFLKKEYYDEYFLFYRIGDYSFHYPIDVTDIASTGCDVVAISTLGSTEIGYDNKNLSKDKLNSIIYEIERGNLKLV